MQNNSSLVACHSLLDKYFPELGNRQAEQFAMLGELYAEWNNRINVVSRKDIDNLYEHHVLHSLAIAKVIDFASGAEVLDVGTGGGFPGIPLAIFFPETHFHMIDSVGKKLKVVDAVADALQLRNVATQHIRAEQLTGKYDFVVSRAVASLPTFIPWMKGKFLERTLHAMLNGMFFLKGGDLTGELQACKERANAWSISDFFTEPFFEEKKVVYIKG
ncbi:MAG: 16S rRNA (guanine(527)-N(7))-methyltransferase RsmG [Bacteroidales bacterium]|jgi:16S rRNA (guanine527-N7)-methyltransferase|nr:16S rRNA (guanine(527)-N(7))-methyltransferase RsmG [Bacteroidales bacterium]